MAIRECKGAGGAIRWGYRAVASLGTWSFTGNKSHGTMTAQVTDVDDVGLEQAPLVVVVPAGASQWRWPVRGLERDGASVRLTVGAVE